MDRPVLASTRRVGERKAKIFLLFICISHLPAHYDALALGSRLRRGQANNRSTAILVQGLCAMRPYLDPELETPNPNFKSNHVVHFVVTGRNLANTTVSLAGTVDAEGVTVNWPQVDVLIEPGSTDTRLKIKAKPEKHRREKGGKVFEVDPGDVQVTVTGDGTVYQQYSCSYED
jgi:hypothetical protein